MCGRYSLIDPNEAMRQLFDYEGPPLDLAPRYNIAPTQNVPVIRLGRHGGFALTSMRWGLIPSWAKEASIGAKMINARAETVAEKPSFRAALAKRRCLVPADGFYEWKQEGGPKQPWRAEMPDRKPFAFAGLWERWHDPAAGAEAPPILSFAIVTTEAAGVPAGVHHRMPVILSREQYRPWIDAEHVPGEAVLSFLAQGLGAALAVRPVSPHVNNARHDDPACIAAA